MSQHSTHSILKQCRCMHSPATLLGPQYWIGVPNKVASWGRNNHGLMRTWLIVINFKMIKMWLYSRCRDSFGLKMLSFGFLHKFVLRTRWLRWSHRMEQKKQTEPGRATNNMSKASLQNCTYYPNSISKVFIGLQVFVKKIILYELACVFERPFHCRTMTWPPKHRMVQPQHTKCESYIGKPNENLHLPFPFLCAF